MNEETFKIICRAFFPACDFTRLPLGGVKANIRDGSHYWRISMFENFDKYGSRWNTFPVPNQSAKTAGLYAALRKQDEKL